MPKSFEQLKRDMRNASKAMAKMETDGPRIAGNESKKVIKENFDIQGYDSGTGVDKWPPRSEKTNAAYDRNRGPGQQGQYKGSVYSSENPLLLQTRNLFNSISYKSKGKSVDIGVIMNLETVGDYAEHQNEGGKGVPARQFMPHPDENPNAKMMKAIYKKFDRVKDQALKIFK